MTKANITPARYRVLALLKPKERGPTVREMCDELGGVTSNSVHEVLRYARKHGLAETDGRAGGWKLTAQGRELVRVLAQVLT